MPLRIISPLRSSLTPKLSTRIASTALDAKVVKSFRKS